MKRTDKTLRTTHSELRTAFTLMEILIVIAIIIVLAGIGVGVGYKFTQAANIEQTKADMTLIMNAIEKYYDETGGYPVPYDTDDSSNEFFELRILRDSGGAYRTEYTNFVNNLSKLSEGTVSTEPDIDGSDTYIIFHFQTKDGQVMQYRDDKAIGGRPLLIAPGDDGKYGTDFETKADRDKYGKDDIRSDK